MHKRTGKASPKDRKHAELAARFTDSWGPRGLLGRQAIDVLRAGKGVFALFGLIRYRPPGVVQGCVLQLSALVGQL